VAARGHSDEVLAYSGGASSILTIFRRSPRRHSSSRSASRASQKSPTTLRSANC
jgi:hypothetical protein